MTVLAPILSAGDFWRLYRASGVDTLDARAVPCRKCGRAAGLRCTRPSGHAAWDAHAIRWDDAVRAVAPAAVVEAVSQRPNHSVPECYRPCSSADAGHQLALGGTA